MYTHTFIIMLLLKIFITSLLLFVCLGLELTEIYRPIKAFIRKKLNWTKTKLDKGSLRNFIFGGATDIPFSLTFIF